MTAAVGKTLQIALLFACLLGSGYPAPLRADTFDTPRCVHRPGETTGGSEQGDAAGSLVHIVQPGDTLIRIASSYRARAGYYALPEILADIRRANDLQPELLRPGWRLIIPVCPRRTHPVVARPVADGAAMRGIYLTGPACGIASVFDRVDRFIAAGGNGVVFDAKDIDGGVSFANESPLASWGRGRNAPVISHLAELIRRLHKRRIHIVARIACFLDGELGRRHPELALADSNGLPWRERDQVWVDPADLRVRSYNIDLAVALARAGVDEIQFDYLRYPTNGWRGDWAGSLAATAERRRQVISGFLRAARDTLRHYPVLLSADLYGIMAWDRVDDQAVTGQNIGDIAALVDVICPMVYPSHYGAGFAGYDRPADYPEHFVAEGCRRFAHLAEGKAAIRPWLQAFPYGARQYDGAYVQAQIAGATAAASSGWCLWNPASRYTVALAALKITTLPPIAPRPITTTVATRLPLHSSRD